MCTRPTARFSCTKTLVVSSTSQVKALHRVEVFQEVQSAVQRVVVVVELDVDVDVDVNAFALKLLDTLSCDSFLSGDEHSPLCKHDSSVHSTTQV